MKDGRKSWCKPCSSAYRKKQYQENKEREYELHRIWVEENRERRRLQNVAATAAWQERNKDKVSYHKNNYKHKRREWERSEGFTLEEWSNLVNELGGLCLACGSDQITVDHVIPLSKGGSHTIDNVQPLCGPCNSRKHTKTTDYRKKES